MRIPVMLSLALLAAPAVAPAQTVGRLTTKETGKLLVARYALEECRADPKSGACRRLATPSTAAEASALESEAARWCARDRSRRAERLGARRAAEIGPNPACAHLQANRR